MEITIHKEKISHLTFHRKKKGQSRVTKIPFTTLNECTGLCRNLYLAVMLIVLECCQTHDMSWYIERQTDCWVCWWMNSRNNQSTHPPLPSLVCSQEGRNARNRSHILLCYSKSDLISSRVFDCPLRPSICLGSKPRISWPPKKTNSKHLNNYYNEPPMTVLAFQKLWVVNPRN